MFNEYNDIFKNVLKLAKKLDEANKKYGENGEELINGVRVVTEEEKSRFMKSENYKIIYSYKSDLKYYLLSLDYDLIKILQTIMYIGRDNDYSQLEPISRVNKVNEQLEDTRNGKEIEIQGMLDKEPLYKYLKKGFKRLQIQID